MAKLRQIRYKGIQRREKFRKIDDDQQADHL